MQVAHGLQEETVFKTFSKSPVALAMRLYHLELMVQRLIAAQLLCICPYFETLCQPEKKSTRHGRISCRPRKLEKKSAAAVKKEKKPCERGRGEEGKRGKQWLTEKQSLIILL